MSELGDALERVHRGRHRVRALRAQVREWRHFPRGREAFSRVMARRGTAAAEAELVEKAPEVTETFSRLWMAKPGRMRLERLLERGPEPNVAVAVVDGERWWSYHPEGGFETSEQGGRSHAQTLAMRQLLDPWPLLGDLGLEMVGESSVAGREAVVLRGTPTEQPHRTAFIGLGQGADTYELAADAELGVLLRTAAKIDGEDFEVKEFSEVVFDPEIPDGVFTFPA